MKHHFIALIGQKAKKTTFFSQSLSFFDIVKRNGVCGRLDEISSKFSVFQGIFSRLEHSSRRTLETHSSEKSFFSHELAYSSQTIFLPEKRHLSRNFNRRFCYHFAIVGLVFLLFSGCGPSRKQYQINEALLIDQTRLLENEVYQTRFQLQKTLEENSQLRKELGLETPSNESTSSSQSNRVQKTQNSSGVPFQESSAFYTPPQNLRSNQNRVSTQATRPIQSGSVYPVSPLQKTPVNPNLQGPQPSLPQNAFPQNAQPPKTSPILPSPVLSQKRSRSATQQALSANDSPQSLNESKNAISNTEELPQYILMPKNSLPQAKPSESDFPETNAFPVPNSQTLPLSSSGIQPSFYSDESGAALTQPTILPTQYVQDSDDSAANGLEWGPTR